MIDLKRIQHVLKKREASSERVEEPERFVVVPEAFLNGRNHLVFCYF